MSPETIFIVSLLSIAIIILVIFVVIPISLKAGIRNLNKKSKQSRWEYVSLMRNIESVKRQTDLFLHRWPIWPRPVLYTKIDTEIQFATAQIASLFSFAQEKEMEVHAVPKEWIQDTEFKRFPLFEYFRMRKLIQPNQRRLNELDNLLYNIREQAQIIFDGQKKQKVKENYVIEQFYKWKEMSQEYQGGVKADGRENTLEYLRIEKAIQGFHLAVQEGSICFEQKQTPDNLYLARVSVCNYIARSLWHHVELDYDIVASIWDRYDLDLTGELLDQALPILRTALLNTHNDQWLELKFQEQNTRQGFYLVANARIKYDEFKKNYEVFIAQLDHLDEVKPDLLIGRASELEGKLDLIWFEYPEWDRVLGGSSEPSKRLQEDKEHWEIDILPQIKSGEIIKQSALPNIIREIRKFILRIDGIKRDINKISVEIRAQESAKERIQSAMQPDNIISRNLAILMSVKDDTTDNIAIQTAQYQSRYQSYCEKLDAERGPNFCKLELVVEDLKRGVVRSVEMHNQVMSKLKQQALRERISLQGSYSSLQSYIEFPLASRIENWSEIVKTLSKLEADYEAAGSSYRKLGGYIENANIQRVNWITTQNALQVKKQNFFIHTQTLLDKIDIRQQQCKDALQSIDKLIWSNLYSYFKNQIIECQDKCQKLTHEVNRLLSENWLDDAIQQIDELPSKINGIKIQMDESVREAQKIDQDINRRYKSVVPTIDKDFRKEIQRKLDQLLYEAQSPDQAYDYLDRVKNKRYEIFISNVAHSNINVHGSDVNQKLNFFR